MVKINSQPNFFIFKEPRGFIKLIELFISVFAFAALCAYAGAFKLTLNCFGKKQGVLFETAYPFSEYRYYRDDPLVCNDTSLSSKGEIDLVESFQSESQFFVFVGVITFLYCLVMIAVYVYVEDQEEEASSTNVGKCSIPVVDFIVSAVLTFFWFVSSCAWASAFSGVKESTTQLYMKTLIMDCQKDKYHSCTLNDEVAFGPLYVSILLGFLNVFVWLGNLWFLFKETPWHSPRRGPSGMAGPPPEQTYAQQQVPEAPSAAI